MRGATKRSVRLDRRVDVDGVEHNGMVRVMITRGAGYVGSVVTSVFLDMGHHVTVLDSLESGGQGLLECAT